MSDTPNSSRSGVEMEETDCLMIKQRQLQTKEISISYTNPSIANRSTSSIIIDNNELFIILLGAAAGNFLEWYNFAIFGLLADIFGLSPICCQ